MAKNTSGLPQYVRQLKERSSEWQCPAVVYEEEQFGTGYEPLGCTKMNVDVDCYWSTAVVKIRGEWKNYLKTDLVLFFICFSHCL